MTYDQLSEAKDIAEKIAANGFTETSNAVRHAVDDGRSGTEIFIKLRFYLKPLLSENAIDSTTHNRIKFLLENIEKSLSR